MESSRGMFPVRFNSVVRDASQMAAWVLATLAVCFMLISECCSSNAGKKKLKKTFYMSLCQLLGEFPLQILMHFLALGMDYKKWGWEVFCCCWQFVKGDRKWKWVSRTNCDRANRGSLSKKHFGNPSGFFINTQKQHGW